MAWTIPQSAWVALELAYEYGSRELRAALPATAGAFLGGAGWWVIEAGAPLAYVPGNVSLALSLPAHEILLRRIDLPLVARRQLADLMRFEAPRHIPLPLDQVAIDFRIISRDLASSRMVAELAIVRHCVVAQAQQWALSAGLQPEAIAVASNQELWFARRLLKRTLRERWFNRRIQGLALRAAIPSFLVLFWVLALQAWVVRLADRRDHELAVARAGAAAFVPLRRQLDGLNAQVAFLSAARNRASAAAITEEVARLLPDDAWLQELVIDGGSVHLRGTARHATALLGAFSASPLFTDVKFEAPLTQVYGAGGDQFDIAMTRN